MGENIDDEVKMQGRNWKGPSDLGNTHKENSCLNLAEVAQ